MNLQTNIQISAAPLDAPQCISWLADPSCGGIDLFVGTVRSHTKGKAVLHLEFEAYERMALSEMTIIAEEAAARWPVQKILMHHRTGLLAVGEIPVIIGVAAAHRDAAFEACRFAIDTLKQTVPIWKKEVFADGELWVSAHP